MIGLDRLAEAPAGLPPLLKATLVLAAAWLVHAALARANPRWRVLTWRCAAVGLAAVAMLALAPPLATWRVRSPAPPPSPVSRPIPIVEPVAAPVVEVATTPVAPIETRAPVSKSVAPRPVARPRPKPAAPPVEPIAWAFWLGVAWLAGAAAGLARWAAGSIRLGRIARAGSEPPAAVLEVCRATAEALGVRRRVRAVVSPAVASPCIAGIRRPTILLPAGMGLDAPGPDLDAVLVHELTHVRNGDLAWNGLWSLAAVALWFHPFAWRTRSVHAAACDAVCDAAAVDRLGDVATYARALARLALKAAPPVGGLAMARVCDVRRRVEALQRVVYRSPLSRRLAVPAVLLSTVLATLVGGLAVIRAQDEPAKPPAAKAGTLVVRVVDGRGKPLEGAEVESSSSDLKTGIRVNATTTTAADGTARVERVPDVGFDSLSLIVRKPGGYVPAGFLLGGRRGGEPFPASGSWEFRLGRGTVLGGQVVDDAGAPVEGATVEVTAPFVDLDRSLLSRTITAPPDDPDVPRPRVPVATLTTDARGRWRTDLAPADLVDVVVKVAHPDYRPTTKTPYRGDWRMVLEKGETVSGKVVGPDGRPIVGAAVKLRFNPAAIAIAEATTDAEGRFALRHARPGELYIVAEADGFAPAFKDVVVRPGADAEGVELAMAPGATIRVRVVDAEGRPLPGVAVAPDVVGGRRRGSSFRTTTDAEGRAAWKDAPPGETAFSFSRRDLMGALEPLTPGGEERVVAMRPPAVVSGTVVDAVTKKPVPKFRVERGFVVERRPEPAWEPGAVVAADGRYALSFDQPRESAIRITAPGYKTAESPTFRPDDPNAATRDFALEPRPWLEGVVRLPDGGPDPTARVALALAGGATTDLVGATFRQGGSAPVQGVDAEGRFAFPRPDPPFLLVAASESGFAEATAEDVAKSSDLKLQPWGRIEGTARIGDKPAAGAWLTFRPDPATRGLNAYVTAQADAQGRYALEPVIPKPGRVHRLFVPTHGEFTRYLAATERADVKPGATTRVDLGGEGRPVVGRAVFDGPVDWPRNRPAVLTAIADAANYHVGEYDRDGRFRVEGVPPGRYRLTVDVDAPGARLEAQAVARGALDVAVPPGDAETPVDVGEVVAKPEKPHDPPVEPAKEEAPAKPDERDKTAMTVRVLDDATGKPLEGAEVESSFFDIKLDKSVKAVATARADGVARVGHEMGARVGNLSLIVRKPGYVPGSFYRGRGGNAEPFPMPEAKEFRLVRGTELGGVAVDEAGAPVAGATVKISMPFADSDFPLMYADVATLTTDLEGRWRTADAPEALGDVHVSVAHPDYRGTSLDAARGESRAVLVKGETVSGRVVGGDGRPIAGAKVKLRDGPSSTGTADAKTDADGRFTIPHAKPGDYYVMAEADGHAPAFRNVTVERGVDAEGVELTMGPGETIRFRVVDAEGRPLPDVSVAPSLVRGREWGSSFRAKTDADGRAVWKDAPAGETTYTFSRRGLMAVRTPLAPGDAERAVVMRPPLVVSGAVVDAVTRKPVPKFQVERGVIGEGSDRPFWQADASDATDGRYSLTFDFPQTWAIRVIAPGYEAAESPGFQVDDQGAATRDFAPKPRAWLRGVVRRPDGSPDPGARVVLLTTSNRGAILDGTTFKKGYGAPAQEVDAEGRYAFPPPEPPFLLVAASEAGYVEAKPEDVARSPDLKLRTWGRIEGTARIGDEPAAGAQVAFQPDRDGVPGERDPVRIEKSIDVQADARGRYVLERVVPGPGKIGRILVSRDGNRRYAVGMEPLDVEPGATARVDVGGGGRPVVGRATYDGPVDWPHNRAAFLKTELGALDIPTSEWSMRDRYYYGEYDGDGRFRIEDVPPGRYRLALRADVQLPVSHPTPAMTPGGTSRSIVVPEGGSTTPVDVGEVALRPERHLKPGDPAPALDLERIDAAGGRFVLGDRRGKVVALWFWTSWLKQFPTIPPKLQELQKERGGDPRFELVGVSLDDAPADAARFVRENGLTGIQAFGGPIGAGAAADFGEAVPSPLVLVGPDGRIIAPFVAWNNLREEVAKALAAPDDKPAAAADKPAAADALVVRVLDDATGKPLEGAEVESAVVDPKVGKVAKATATAAADGVVKITRDPDVKLQYLSLIVRRPGYAPTGFYRDARRNGEPFPMPESREFRLVRGEELGGVVVDEAGAPVEGATVALAAPFPETDTPMFMMPIVTLKTDAQGRWRTDQGPKDLGNVSIAVEHPDYQKTAGLAARGDLRFTLTKGETVTGRVVDPDGRPIAGANVRVRSETSPFGIAEAASDADGRFTLKNARPGEFFVMAEADGFAPAFKDVAIQRGAGAEGVELTMEPGATIHIRVVDADGRPLQDVAVAPFLVRGRQRGSLYHTTTDAEGRAGWKDAPAGETTYTFSRRDLRAVQAALAPGAEERVVVMRPPLVVSGTVVDAVTKRPVPRFHVERGYVVEQSPEPIWQRDGKDATDGRYSLTFDQPWTATIRITAPGYKTAVSPGFKLDDPDAATRDFALEPQPWLRGVVLLPDGAPDPTAKVALAVPRSYPVLEGTTFRKGLGAPGQAVDAEGRYAFPRPESPFTLVAASESGYADATPDEFARSPDLKLQPWGRVEGTARIGDQPAAGAWLEYRPDRPRPGALSMDASVRAQADEQGKFILEHIVPKPGYVGREHALRDGKHATVAWEFVEVKPGATARVDVGGGGRPVVGRAVFNGAVDWTGNRPASLSIDPEEGRANDGRYYVGEFDRDGRFRIEDARPGRYRLSIQIDPPVPPSLPGRPVPLGKATRPVVVPEGDPATPVDVGEVVVEPTEKP